MKSVRSPHLLIVSLLITVMVALLFGIARTFATVRAASSPTVTPPVVSWTETPVVAQVEEEGETDTLTPLLMAQTHATDGIMILAIILIAIILVGVIWGQRTRRRTSRPSKK